MNENITRISDLPDNYNTHMSSKENDLGLQNSYIPLNNVHPPPYGITPSPESQTLNMDQKRMIDNTAIQRLPSRDIRMEPIQIIQDEQTQPNYIPADDLTNDFVLEYEKNRNKTVEKHNQEKHRLRLMDRVFTELQLPLLMAVLFFVFQMPWIDRLFARLFMYFHLYNTDGQINLYGMLLKSVLFGLFYYGVMMTTDFISEF